MEHLLLGPVGRDTLPKNYTSSGDLGGHRVPPSAIIIRVMYIFLCVSFWGFPTHETGSGTSLLHHRNVTCPERLYTYDGGMDPDGVRTKTGDPYGSGTRRQRPGTF